jgi:hypothetical protein
MGGNLVELNKPVKSSTKLFCKKNPAQGGTGKLGAGWTAIRLLGWGSLAGIPRGHLCDCVVVELVRGCLQQAGTACPCADATVQQAHECGQPYQWCVFARSAQLRSRRLARLRRLLDFWGRCGLLFECFLQSKCDLGPEQRSFCRV